MRDPRSLPNAAVRIERADLGRRGEALLLVCGALVLALVTLAGQIVASW